MKNFSFFKSFAILCVFFTGQNELFGGLACSGGDCRDKQSGSANRETKRAAKKYQKDAARKLGLQVPSHSPQAPRVRVQAPRQQVPLPSSSFSSAPVPGVLPSQSVPFQSRADRPPTPAYMDEMNQRIARFEKRRKGKGLSDDGLAFKLANAEGDLRDAKHQANAGKGEYLDYLDDDPGSVLRAEKEAEISRQGQEYVKKFGAKTSFPPKTLMGYADREESFGLDGPIGRGKKDGVGLDLFNPATQVQFNPKAAPGAFRSLSPEPPTKGVLKPISRLSPLPPSSAPEDGFSLIKARFGGVNPQESGPSARHAAILDGSDQSDPFNPPQKDPLSLYDVDDSDLP